MIELKEAKEPKTKKQTRPLVAIVIPDYNGQKVQYQGKGILENVLESLKITNYRNYKVVVSDDSSPPPNDSASVAAKFNIPYVLHKPNGGFAKNCNFGARYAIEKYNPDYILWLNNDIIVTDPEWLTKMVDSAESDPKIGMVGCKLVFPNGDIQRGYSAEERNQKDSEKYDYIKETNSVDGAAFFAKRAVIDKVGLLDEMYTFGWEDADYCMRVKDAGFRFIYNGKVKLTHLEGASSTTSVDKKRRYRRAYTDMTNYLKFMWKYNKRFTLGHKLNSVATMAASVFVTSNESSAALFKIGKYRFHPDPLTKMHAYFNAVKDTVAPQRMVYRYFLERGLGKLFIEGAVKKLKRELKNCNGVDDIVNLAYTFNHHGITIGPFQVKREIAAFAKEVAAKQPKEILEIGTAKGGTLFIIAQCVPNDAHIVSLDLPNGQFGGGYPSWKIPLYRSFAKEGQKLELVRLNSHSHSTFETIKEIFGGKPLDLLFIDADHTYDGIKQDFGMYSSLVKHSGTIAMHDIAQTPSLEINVAPFWREIKGKYKTKEIIENYWQGYGIGLITVE